MAKLTFIGGIHPYDGKDLSRDRAIQNVQNWHIRFPSISVRLRSRWWPKATGCWWDRRSRMREDLSQPPYIVPYPEQ